MFGVTVVGVLYFGALAEQCVGFVEEQHGVRMLGRSEHALEIAFRFSDVLAHHRSELDAIQIEPELACDRLGGQGFAGA